MAVLKTWKKTKLLEERFQVILVQNIENASEIVGGEDQANVCRSVLNGFFGHDVIKISLSFDDPTKSIEHIVQKQQAV